MVKRLKQIRDIIYFVLDLLTGYRPVNMQLYRFIEKLDLLRVD